MFSIFNRICCRCHDQGTSQIIEFDADHDPDFPDYKAVDGSISRRIYAEQYDEHGEHTAISFPSKVGIESDDTDDVFEEMLKPETCIKENREEEEVNKAWKEAAAMRNISYKMPGRDSESILDPSFQGSAKDTIRIDAKNDGVLTYDEFNKSTKEIASTPLQGKNSSAYDSNPNLKNIQGELARTRALLGLPPKRLGDDAPKVTSNAQAPGKEQSSPAPVAALPTPAVIPNAPASDEALSSPTPLVAPSPAPLETTPNLQETTPNLHQQQLAQSGNPPVPANNTSSALSDAPPESQSKIGVNDSREEQKQKIKDEVAALRMRVRKAKNDILANQYGVGGLRAHPGMGSGTEPSPREGSRFSHEDSRATKGSFMSADMSTL
mmetsp:Transcript_84264/g.132705  ORF Transcript_84264/g.132705 Transcript_84264/m.132705 type:complete len:380 (-) Transcript_84264:79-1218(-)